MSIGRAESGAAESAAFGRRAWVVVMTAAVGMAILVAGCGPAEIRRENKTDPTIPRLMTLGAAYITTTLKNGRPPAGPEDLRGMLPAAEALVSPRDGAPFTIFWGVDTRSSLAWAKSRPILAHESRGVDGSRYVLTTAQTVELVTDEELRASSFPPGKQAP